VDDPPATVLRRLITGFQVSQAIHVAATLGIADHLADGPRSSDELAQATESHPRSLYRLLRALAAIGLLHEDEERRFSLTPLGELLRRDVPESLAGSAAYVGRPYYWQAWANLLYSVRTGENAFRHVHGVDVWAYRAEHPEESEIFDRAMESLTRGAGAALIEAYDFGRFATVVDVGGGNGTLLAQVLAAHPALQGLLFDQPHVVAGAECVLQEAGVSDRCRVVASSFFDAVPEGCDAYLLKHIVHDWGDRQATAILQAVRRAVPSEGALLVLERVVGPPNKDLAAKLGDLNMLVMPGGKERTLDEYAALFAGAGFRLVGAMPTAAGVSVIEAAPA
jgi:hypothetical protein